MRVFGLPLLLDFCFLSLVCKVTPFTTRLILLYYFKKDDSILELLHFSDELDWQSCGVELIYHHLVMKCFRLDFLLDILRS